MTQIIPPPQVIEEDLEILIQVIAVRKIEGIIFIEEEVEILIQVIAAIDLIKELTLAQTNLTMEYIVINLTMEYMVIILKGEVPQEIQLSLMEVQ